jgi:hypothetical protein
LQVQLPDSEAVRPAEGGTFLKQPKRPTVFVLLGIAVVLLIASFVLLPSAARLDRQTGRRGSTANAVVGASYGFSVEPIRSGELLPFGSGLVLRCLDNEIEVLNLSGQVEYALRATITQPQIIADDRRAFLYDLGGSYYCMLEGSGPLFEGRVEDVIRGAYRGPNGYFALLLDRYDTRGVLAVYDEQGRRIFEWISQGSENSGYILSSAFAPDGSSIDLSLMNTDGAHPRPVILRLSLAKGSPGEELARLQPDIRTALPKLTYTADHSLWMTDGRAIYSYDPESKATVLRYNFHSVHSISAWGNSLIVVGVYPEREGIQLYQLTGDLKDVESGILLSGDPVVPVMQEEYMGVAAGNRLHLIGHYDLHRIRTVETDEPVLALGLDRYGDLLYITRSEVALLEN